MRRDTGATGGPDGVGEATSGPDPTARHGATQAATVATYRVHFRRGDKGRRRLRSGQEPKPTETNRVVPRIAKLMALAIHLDKQIRAGVFEDYADIARLGGVSRARVSQIMDLLNLAPNVQEELLYLRAGNRVSERSLRGIATTSSWAMQTRTWNATW
ncbi:MAG: hypothetical protein R3E97_24845 [Candidatus Eisenbacteria bacterium]